VIRTVVANSSKNNNTSKAQLELSITIVYIMKPQVMKTP